MAKEKLSEMVAERIKKDIAAKKYKTGEKIPAEPELMEAYQVGRSSVREAIKSLAMAGVLRVQQGNGTFVNEQATAQPLDQRLHNADFDEINAVRMLLETELVKLAVDHHTQADLDAMHQHLTDRRHAIETENKQACTNADIAFHTAIATASRNKVLADLYDYFTLSIRSLFSKREQQGIAHFAMSHYLHDALFDAIRGKKKKEALKIIQQILSNNY
ncbi:FadR/GntR family transcriptional regulator [Mucilaginibacter gynuensis]